MIIASQILVSSIVFKHFQLFLQNDHRAGLQLCRLSSALHHSIEPLSRSISYGQGIFSLTFLANWNIQIRPSHGRILCVLLAFMSCRVALWCFSCSRSTVRCWWSEIPRGQVRGGNQFVMFSTWQQRRSAVFNSAAERSNGMFSSYLNPAGCDEPRQDWPSTFRATFPGRSQPKAKKLQ